MAEDVLAGFVVAVLIALAVIDVRTRRVPNKIVLPATAIVLLAQIAIAPDRWFEWVIASLATFVVFLVAALLNPGGLGMGDVKLALLLGAALGWSVLAALIIGFLAAAAAGLVMIARYGWAGRKATLPLVPFLALGGIAALFI
jgi:leader peptidase (prepilin peptidase) / N-methyltransferase